VTETTIRGNVMVAIGGSPESEDLQAVDSIGAPGRTRTCDLGIRNPDQGDTEKHQEVPTGNGIKDLDWKSF